MAHNAQKARNSRRMLFGHSRGDREGNTAPHPLRDIQEMRKHRVRIYPTSQKVAQNRKMNKGAKQKTPYF